ncbi:MAG: DUF2877 domain-containing protein [Candidatus Rokuibacteriota bacterium]
MAATSVPLAWRLPAAGDRFPVELLGRAAGAAFAAESQWWVLAVFRRTFYCESAAGALVCLGPRSMGAGPLNAIAAIPPAMAWDAAGLRAGASATRHGSAFGVDGRFVFSLDGSGTWRPPAMPAGGDPAALARGLAALAAAARVRAPREGLGRLIPLLADGPGTGADGALEAPALRLALRGARALAWWLGRALAGRRTDVPSPPDDVTSLIGLGPGLTPSGDDFLGGALMTLHALGRSGPADALGAWVLARASSRTHAISRAHLACAVQGEGMAAAHETLVALAGPESPRGLPACLDAVEAIGHTSGWDALAGAWVAGGVVSGGQQYAWAPECAS